MFLGKNFAFFLEMIYDRNVKTKLFVLDFDGWLRGIREICLGGEIAFLGLFSM